MKSNQISSAEMTRSLAISFRPAFIPELTIPGMECTRSHAETVARHLSPAAPQGRIPRSRSPPAENHSWLLAWLPPILEGAATTDSHTRD